MDEKRKVGRPRGKEPKTKIGVMIRSTILARYRRFIGTATILGEAVEQAMKLHMQYAKERKVGHGA